MNSNKIVSVSDWADQLFSVIDHTAFPEAPNHLSVGYVGTGDGTNAGYNNFWVGDWRVDPLPEWRWEPYFRVVPQIIEIVTTHVKEVGSPWSNTPNFPPVNIELHPATKELRFTWALAGVRKEHDVEVEFNSDKLILHIQSHVGGKEVIVAQDTDQSETLEVKWVPLISKLKASVAGDYSYDVPSSRYNVQDATAKWEDGLLIVNIPLREDAKPVKVKIQA